MQGLVQNPSTDPEVVAECMALLAVGHSCKQVEDRTGVPQRTVSEWARSPTLAAKYGEATKAARQRLAYRWGQVVEDSLDKIEKDEEKITAVQAMVGWGIATDKVQKDSTPSRSGSFVTIRTSDGTVIEAGSSA